MQKVIYRNQVQEYAQFIDQTVIDYIGSDQIETYESFRDYDLIAFDWYDLTDASKKPAQILLYIDRDDLFFICENEIARTVAQKLFAEDPSNEHAMYLFFRNLFKTDASSLEMLESKVSELDDAVIRGAKDGLRERLIAMRTGILQGKKYFEQLEFLFDEICDNDNRLFSEEGLKYFEVLHNRFVRLSAQAANLREYITQVRESYQAQIGIEQNNLMKLFTLVTSIFLPLTLIAGWYGMNVKIPEYGWEYGYLFVAALCLAVCAVWYFAFKKKKWFK